MKNAAIGLIVFGVISLVMSWAWPRYLSPKPPVMDEQQAEQFTQAVGDLHMARATGQEDPEQKKMMEEHKAAVESATRTKEIGTAVFKYLGIIAALAGAGLFFFIAQSED